MWEKPGVRVVVAKVVETLSSELNHMLSHQVSLLLQGALDWSSGVLVLVLPVLPAVLTNLGKISSLSTCMSPSIYRSPRSHPVFMCQGSGGEGVNGGVQWMACGKVQSKHNLLPTGSSDLSPQLVKGSPGMRGLAHRANNVGSRLGKGVCSNKPPVDFSSVGGRCHLFGEA